MAYRWAQCRVCGAPRQRVHLLHSRPSLHGPLTVLQELRQSHCMRQSKGTCRVLIFPSCGFPQGDFGLSLFEDGVLPAAFMVGLLGASLVFAQVRAPCQPCAGMMAGLRYD